MFAGDDGKSYDDDCAQYFNDARNDKNRAYAVRSAVRFSGSGAGSGGRAERMASVVDRARNGRRAVKRDGV